MPSMEPQVSTGTLAKPLPPELLIQIIGHVTVRNDLGSLRLVSKQFRALCEPVLFRSITVKYRSTRLKMLKTLTNPDLPKHAQVLRYVLGLWVKPAVNESGFDLHIRDPDSGHEDECLKHAIQQLSNLTTLILDFGLGNRTASQRNNREIARKRRVTTSQSSRLRAALSALSSSEDLLTNMEMRSYNYGPVDDDLKSINFTGNALSKITSLSLYDCFTWYNRTFPHLNIPSLRSLYLRHTAVRVPILEDFTQRHRKTLRSLKMEKFWLTWRENDSKPQDIFTTEKLLAFERIAKLDILKTVRLRRVLQSFRKLVSPDYTLCFFP